MIVAELLRFKAGWILGMLTHSNLLAVSDLGVAFLPSVLLKWLIKREL